MAIGSSELKRLLDHIEDRVRDHLLFVTAFDGVLAEHQPDRDRVAVTQHRRVLLKHLLDAPGVSVAVVSGRSIADLRRRIDLGSRLFYVGLHGLESAGPGFSRVQREVIDAFDNRLLDVANILRPIIGGIRGVELDVTQAVITLHTPHRSPDALWSRFQLFDIFADLLSSGVVRVIRSQNAIAVLPDAGSSTAEAIRAVGQFLEGEAGTSVYTVYLGEDSSDDDALDSVAEPGAGAGVVIGRRRAQAEFHLPAAELDQFVEALALLRASAPQS